MQKKVTLAGHRGWRGKYPENTMLGFRKVLELDIDAIEMDVHMTKDYRIVVCHDANLGRTTDVSGNIYHMTLDEIRKADAGIKFGEEFKGEKVPTLDEFLELMSAHPDVRVLLELKDYPEDLGDFAYASAEAALSLCKKYGIFGNDRLTVITFSTNLCAWLRARHTKEEFYLHGFFPKALMKGWEKDDPYKYYDEVCLFNGGKSPEGLPLMLPKVADKARYKEFELMEIKPCTYLNLTETEAEIMEAYEKGALGFTSDYPDVCGQVLDKIGARKLKK